MDKEMEHICGVLDIGKKSRHELVNEGILTFEDLCEAKEKLCKHDVGKVKPGFQTELYDVICWYDHFEEQEGRQAIICEDLDDETLEKTFAVAEESYIELFKMASQSQEGCTMYEALEKRGSINKMVKTYSRQIAKGMTPALKKGCGNFDFEAFGDKIVEYVYKPQQTPDKKQQPIVVAGKTQSGKSAVKGVVQAMCALLKIPLIVVTKGVGESRELHSKLKRFAAGTTGESHIVATSNPKNSGGGAQYKTKQMEIEEAIHNAGTLVVADTWTQITKAIIAMEKYQEGEEGKNKKFVVVVDECDAMYRTEDRAQRVEQAYDKLMAMNPSLTVMISATPITFMLELATQPDVENEDIPMFEVEPTSQYRGLKDMKPLEDEQGNPKYLCHSELSWKDGFEFKNEEFIPYTNDEVMLMYDDALKGPKERKGVLVLDCTSPRVSADGNVFQKAELVQEYYLSQDKNIVVVTYVGNGINVRDPNGKKREWENHGRTHMDKVLKDIDTKHGLETPVFIFGFAKMRRGISFRSAERVPTHLVILLGRGHNLSNVVQAMGRATGNWKAVLEENGFDHSTILTSSNDWTMAEKVDVYIQEVSRRIRIDGQSFHEAMTGASEKLPDEANFLRHSFREIGQLKGQRALFKDLVDFVEPEDELTLDEMDFKKKFWKDACAQRLMRTLLELKKKEPGKFVTATIIHEAYNDTYENDDSSIKKSDLNKYLTKFKDHALIRKIDEGWYEVQHSLKRLRQFVNDALAMNSKEIGDGQGLDELFGLAFIEDKTTECESTEGKETDDEETEDEETVASWASRVHGKRYLDSNSSSSVARVSLKKARRAERSKAIALV